MNFYSDVSEWQYLFKNVIDWDSIIPLYYPEFPTPEGFQNKEELLGFFEELLTTMGKWTGETLAPRARELDQMGGGELVNGKVQVKEILQKTYNEAKELDVFGMALDRKYDGMGVPGAVVLFGFTQICRACMSTSTQLGFFGVIADMIERFCEPEIRDKYIPMIRRGEISGSMCLTEADCGSDVGALRTSADPQPDGTYLLNGTKRFITNGGGGLAFILARVKGAPAGLAGISMFFAEEWMTHPTTGEKKHNYQVTKIEEKMGLHGSITCEVHYENTVARLVGKENDGFKLMLHLMNEARLSVGLQGIGMIEAALGMAREYGESRIQFGKPLTELPLMKRNFEDWETERDALRAMVIDTMSYYDIFQKLDLKKRHTDDLTEKETALFRNASKIVRRRTPLVKYYGAELATLLTQRSIQAFGGYGFMEEYDVERIHRDSFAALLYEGTSQIQSLMALKDYMKSVAKEPKHFFQALIASHPLGGISETEVAKTYRSVTYEFRRNVVSLLMKCFKPELSISENGFSETVAQLNKFFKREYWEEEGRFDRLMTHAETLCQALSYRETLKVLAQHATKDASREGLYHRYLRLMQPKMAAIYMDWKLR